MKASMLRPVYWNADRCLSLSALFFLVTWATETRSGVLGRYLCQSPSLVRSVHTVCDDGRQFFYAALMCGRWLAPLGIETKVNGNQDRRGRAFNRLPWE